MESKAFISEWKALLFVAETAGKAAQSMIIYRGQNKNAEILDHNFEPIQARYNGKDVRFELSPGEIGVWVDLVPVI